MKILVLNATNQSITAVMSGAAATTNPDVIATYADSTSTAFTEAPQTSALNGTTPVTVVSSPAASTRRVIVGLSIFNRDTAAVTVDINFVDGANTRRLWHGTLQTNEVKNLDGVFDANGAIKTGASSIAASDITSGVVALARGGTHADLSATGGAYQVLKQLTSGGDVSVGLPGSASLNAFTTFSGSAALTISSISQVFQDLEVTLLIRSGTAAASDSLYVQFGAGALDTTAANYTSYEIVHLGATGSITQSAIENFGSVAQLKMSVLGNTAPASGVALIVLRIPRYSSADSNKQIKGQNTGLYQASAGGFWAGQISGEWRNTSAIQQIKLTLLSGANFATGCAYSVRGLAA